MKLRRLPDTELEVLQTLWDAGGPQPRSWIEHRLADKGWASNTFNTYLARLTEKGFLSCEKRARPITTRLWSPGRPIWTLRAGRYWASCSAGRPGV